MKIDDSLDVLAVHGFGGATGTILTAVLAVPAFAGIGLERSMGEQLGVQALGVVAVVAWSAIASIVIVRITQAVVGLRVSDDEELAGLDQTAHGETGYNL